MPLTRTSVFLIFLSGLYTETVNSQFCGCSPIFCCSRFGFCGISDDYCGSGCLLGPCKRPGGNTSSTVGGSVSNIVTQSFFNGIIKQADGDCAGKKFYTRDSFVNAANTFPNFTSSVTRREIATMFAHFTYLIGPFCYIEAIKGSSLDYCDENNRQYPCAPGKTYFGRGPMQLTWNYNYGPCGKSLGLNLLGHPELVSSNPTVAFRTGLWFWMENVRPVLSQGFGATIRAINGMECNGGDSGSVEAKIMNYKDYCGQLGVDPVVSRTFTIENKCEYTIWPASYDYSGSINTSNLVLEKGEKHSINASSSWIGRVWGRTLCSTNSKGSFSCVTGGCILGQQAKECLDNSTRPTTVAEFNLAPNGSGSADYYDVNVVDGYNLPLLVTPVNEKCKSIGCDIDIARTCPLELMLNRSSSSSSSISSTGRDHPIACRTTCQKEKTRELCCVGIYAEEVVSPADCKRTSYSKAFDNACPGAYSYVYDTNSSTFTCPYTSDYVITFCPSSGIKTSYAQVKKMTKSFAVVLGKGGFGIVYKGKLSDGGQEVAVKILKDDSNENGEEFINEVASMSRTSHVNIVSLLGFCYERNKKAIIYEFMPNGSLDKFLSEKMSTKMEWKTLYNIAVGVSHGLEYLHNRCVSRIVHFDIKPQNILMDEKFIPKISDFGLAKLCKNNESVMSMLGTRGTAGYIAPEVFTKNFGGVSHKSDVYSYGMVVLEMIGAKNIERAQNVGSDNASMYFPDWIYKDLEKRETLSFFADQITEEEG
ncbi:unnamed protein product [Cochlearia groenlandica]